MRSVFEYVLPETLIAQTPLEDRAASRLLVLHRESGQLEHRSFRDIVDLLQPKDLLVLNDTRVTALRLQGSRDTGSTAEFLLLSSLGDGRFRALAKPAKRLRPGTAIEFSDSLSGIIVENNGNGFVVIDFGELAGLKSQIERLGEAPLPPYIHEKLFDRERYQTVYSQSGGSAAAPTAGLHFTADLLEQLRAKGIQIAHVTLDVSLDTFRPMNVEDPDDHVMHGETCRISEEDAKKINSANGRIIAVGTTSVRTLESFAVDHRRVGFGEMDTKLFIRPGYDFKIVDGMITNFHLPRTTMLHMLSAFSGEKHLQAAYEEAIARKYRFLSFGDSMLIF